MGSSGTDVVQMLGVSSDYRGQATSVVEASRKQVERLRAQHFALGRIHAQAQHQYQTLGEITHCSSRSPQLGSVVDACTEHSAALAVQMTDILAKLSDTPVDSVLSEAPAHQSLNDFVDEGSISHLQSRAMAGLKDMRSTWYVFKSTADTFGTLTDALTPRMAEITKEFAGVSMDKQQANVARQTQMLEILRKYTLELASVHDRAEHGGTLNDTGTRSEAGVLLQRIIDCHDRVVAGADELTHTEEQHQHLLEKLANLLNAFEELREEVTAKTVVLVNTEYRFGELMQNTRGVLDELAHLVAWYGLYLEGYFALVKEVQRREAEAARVQSVVERMADQLQAMHQGELQHREEFLSQYGCYLPLTLCPSIGDEPPRFQIYREVAEEP